MTSPPAVHGRCSHRTPVDKGHRWSRNPKTHFWFLPCCMGDLSPSFNDLLIVSPALTARPPCMRRSFSCVCVFIIFCLESPLINQVLIRLTNQSTLLSRTFILTQLKRTWPSLFSLWIIWVSQRQYSSVNAYFCAYWLSYRQFEDMSFVISVLIDWPDVNMEDMAFVI